MQRVEAPGLQLRLVYVLWFIVLTDPQFLLQSFGLGPATRVPIMLAGVLVLCLAANPSSGDWLLGLLAFVGATAINLPFAFNRGNLMPPFRALILYYLVGIGVTKTVKTPRQAIGFFSLLCVVQYLWWAAMGLRQGMVPWHPNLANFDGYGPLMVIGVGPAYFYAMSVPKGTRRNIGLLASGLCVAGVVSAFARGSTLTLIVVVFHIWLRSPRKARAAGIAMAGLAIVVIASSLIDGTTRGEDTKSNFWDEMSTSFDQSAGSTGADRKTLWAAAVIVFKHYPVFGVGAENFGPAATTVLKPGDIPGAVFNDNPGMLYARALHSNYYQLLSEYGLVGVAIFGFLLYQFAQRTREIRRVGSVETWKAGGGIEDPRMLALGLEVGLVAYLVSGYFYNQLFAFWMFSFLIANALLHSLVMKQQQAAQAPAPRRRVMVRAK